MLLFVGLGNPSPDNENNRHNIGFKIIGAINRKFSLSKQKPKFKGLLTTGKIGEKKVYAIKPLTFMNNSGVCIRELIEYFKIDAENVIVFHADMDIGFGKIKAKFGGSSAGHNGIESIDKFIGKEYSRVRIGIGRPNGKLDASSHVLKDLTPELTADMFGIPVKKLLSGANLTKGELAKAQMFINKYADILWRMLPE